MHIHYNIQSDSEAGTATAPHHVPARLQSLGSVARIVTCKITTTGGGEDGDVESLARELMLGPSGSVNSRADLGPLPSANKDPDRAERIGSARLSWRPLGCSVAFPAGDHAAIELRAALQVRSAWAVLRRDIRRDIRRCLCIADAFVSEIFAEIFTDALCTRLLLLLCHRATRVAACDPKPTSRPTSASRSKSPRNSPKIRSWHSDHPLVSRCLVTSRREARTGRLPRRSWRGGRRSPRVVTRRIRPRRSC